MTIQTLRNKLADKKIKWIDSSKERADDDSRFKPDDVDGVNCTLVYIPSTSELHLDDGKEVVVIVMSPKQYEKLFNEYGYKTNP